MEIGSVLISFALLTGGGAGVDTGGLGTQGQAGSIKCFTGLEPKFVVLRIKVVLGVC